HPAARLHLTGEAVPLAEVQRTQRPAQSVDDAVAFGAGDHQGRAQGNGIAIAAAPAGAGDNHTVISAKIDNAGDLRRVDRLLRGAIFDELHADKEALAANITDDLVAHQPAQPVE